MKNKYYYLYKITNQLDGKIYIGVHQTNNLEDGYMGSGTRLSLAKKKHGLENFVKEVLQQFDSEDEMYQEETVLVDKEFVLRKDTYNIKEGGHGGFTPEQQSNGAKAGGKISGPKSYEHKSGWFSKTGKENHRKYLISEENLQKLLENSRKIAESEEIQNKKKETYKKIKHQQGSNNSQFGKMWITDGKESRSIRKEEEIPDGWKRGRKFK